MSEPPVAVLTGGAQGLGAAICKALLDKGYKVCVSDVQEEKGKEFVKEQQKKYGADNVKFIACDVIKEEDYEKLFQFAMKEFKKIDLVLNNAGIVLEQNPKKTIEVNLMGPIYGCQLALKYMGKKNGGKGGMVINTASLGDVNYWSMPITGAPTLLTSIKIHAQAIKDLGFYASHAAPAYHASKHGVIGLTRSYGTPYHLERDGVLFAAICPYFINTEILEKCRTNALVHYDPLKNNVDDLMSPEYVVQGVLKLVEDGINGATLAVTKKGYTYIGIQEEVKECIN